MVEAESVVVVVMVASVPAAGASTVVDSVVFDSHEVRPAVRARPRAANFRRFFILGVFLKMGWLKNRPLCRLAQKVTRRQKIFPGRVTCRPAVY